ncbi:MAG: hypothetical protein Fur0044_12430 [Anaerolineae bacterium]
MNFDKNSRQTDSLSVTYRQQPPTLLPATLQPATLLLATLLLATLLPSLACVIGGSGGTAIPVGRPASFEVQTATPTLNPQLATSAPAQTEPEVVLPLGSAPTDTPDLNATPTLPPPPPDTSTPIQLITPTLELTPTLALTQEVAAAPPTKPKPVVEPDPPLQGGDWDFETEFIPWPNPYGEPCPGARVAAGWTAFVENGPYGSSCMNENLYQPNVFSGLKSQEMTFDFIAANSGVLRTIPTKVGHRYQVVAHAKNDRSIAPVQMALGLDLTGGGDWTSGAVQWFPWDNTAEDTWNPTEETITATGESMTIFIKGFHPMADQGGKTVIDTVSVTDLGPE